MRKVVYSINLSIDGNCSHTGVNPEEEMYDFFINLMRDADLIVYGRKTYDLMVPYWPALTKSREGTKGEIEFADTFTAINKVVFSKTLTTVDANTRIVRDGLEDEIRRLKQLPGKNISVGGVDLPSQLMAAGLIDEYHFVVHPVIAGNGTRLLDNIGLQHKINLKLVNAKVFGSGLLGLHYVKQ